MTFSPLTVSIRPDNVGVVDEACRAVAGCGPPSLVSVAAMVFVAVVLAALFGATLHHLREARSVVTAEQRRTRAERDAFVAFADRLERIDATPDQSVEVGGSVVSLAAQPADRRLERVRDAYRETVMAVPHYEAEYDEPLAENMAAEIGEEVAAAVTDGRQLTPRVKGSLIEGSQEAKRRREQLLDDLEHEAEVLAESADTLESVDESVQDVTDRPLYARKFDALVDLWDRLDDLEARCQRVVRRRQNHLDGGPDVTAVPDAPSLQQYLYGSLDVDHPVVADATTMLSRVRETRSDLVDAVSRRG